MASLYDPFSPEVVANPFPYYARLREQAPVHPVEKRLWAVSRYEDVSTVLRSPAFSASATRLMMMGGLESRMQADEATLREERRRVQRELGLGSPLGTEEGWNEDSLISLDPPQHEVVRNIVNRGFTPRRIARLAPRIREIADGLVNDILARGEELDLTADISTPLPVLVMAELLGVDAADAVDFKRWSDVVISGITGDMAVEGPAPLLRTLDELARYFLEVVEQRRREPRDDLISVLIAAEDSATLSPVETVNFAILLLSAGNETTMHLIDNAVLALLDHPEQYQKVVADPSLVPRLVEETLRWDGPVQQAFREATRDVEIAGTLIPKGDIAITLFGSANRDERQFPDGERFDIFRDTQGHMGFGFGVHFCLGASLARLEAQIALETLLTRLPNLRRGSAEIERFDSFLVRGHTSLPLRYDARGA